MISETQMDLEWAGLEAAQGGTGARSERSPRAENGVTASRYLTDEEILGIESTTERASPPSVVIPSPPAGRAGGARNLSEVFPDDQENQQRDSSGKNRPQNDNASESASLQPPASNLPSMPEWMQAAASDPRHGVEAQQLWREHQEFRSAFSSADEARAIKELLPGGVRDVLSLCDATQSVERIDAAIFSGDARAQSEVVAELARANPAAFRSLFAEAARVLAGLGTNTILRENGEGWGTRNSEAGPQRNGVILSAAKNLSSTDNLFEEAASARPHESRTFDPAAYAAFERGTNDAVAREVRGSISDTLSRVLPEGVADGAARRIGEDIFQEIHRALGADRTLSEQVGALLRDRRFGSAEQQRVASLLAGRARQLVPSVARRIIGEWTSTVLNTARSKASRQAAAASRVDIATPGGSLDSTPLRRGGAGSRGVDYSSMSDEEILGM